MEVRDYEVVEERFNINEMFLAMKIKVFRYVCQKNQIGKY